MEYQLTGTKLAASALAANTFLRSAFGAIFPLFASYMFDDLGIQWAMTLLGCVASLLAPVPVVFYLKGAKIRQTSIYAPTGPPVNVSGTANAKEV